jgi:hypothetical protein
MQISRYQNKIILAFASEEDARQAMILLNLESPPSVESASSPLARVLVTDQKAMDLENRRNQRRSLNSAQQNAENRLRDGALPFRVQQRPSRTPLPTSPRIQAMETGFAGESPSPPKPTAKKEPPCSAK